MADTLSELAGQPPNDPEAQAAINDFSDFTEFFPSDLFRSLTLIGKLDKACKADTANVHKLTKVYSTLPKLPQLQRPNPQQLRQDVSASLDHALRSRESTLAEASRLCNVVDNLHNRLSGIRAKLSAMPKPPSRDPTPPPRSPVAVRSRRTDVERTPRLKLHLDLDKGSGSGRQLSTVRPKNRQRRIIVPGEIMPPFDPLSPGASIASDSEPDREPSPVRAPASTRPKSASREKSMPLKIPKLKLVANTSASQPKTPRVRPQGVMGTNVHSTVAGISVSNAMATLTPPPSSPEPGSQWAPWRELTQWEIYTIRRKMKKNANWQPSDVMVARELAVHGRGLDNYRKAKAAAAAQGEPVLDEPAHESSGEKKQILAEIASMDPPHDPNASDNDEEADEEEEMIELDKKEQWRLQEQQKMEEMSKVINMHHSMVEGLLGPGPLLTPTVNGHMQSVNSTSDTAKRSARKRKRYPPKATSKSQSLTNGVEAQLTARSQQKTDTNVTQSSDDDAPLDSAIDPALIEDGSMSKPNVAITDGFMPKESHAALDDAIDPALTDPDTTVNLKDDELENSQHDDQTPAKKLKLVGPGAKSGGRDGISNTQIVPLGPPGTSAPAGSVIGPGDYSSPKSTRSSRRAAQNASGSSDMPPPPTPTSSNIPKSSTTAKGRKNPSLSIKLPSTIAKSAAAENAAPSVRRNASRNASLTSDTSSAVSSTVTTGHKNTLPPTPPVLATAASRRGSRRSDATDTPTIPPSSKVFRNTTNAASTPTSPATSVRRRNTTDNTTTSTNGTKTAPSKITIRGPIPKSASIASKGAGNKTPRTPRTPITPWGLQVAREAPADEQRFCSCGAPSYGDMVACDDAACEVEWFHLECVGLEVKPTRRELWYCVGCRKGKSVDERGIEV